MNIIVELPGTSVTNNFLFNILDEYIVNDNDCHEDFFRELEVKIKYHSDCLARESNLYEILLHNREVKSV